VLSSLVGRLKLRRQSSHLGLVGYGERHAHPIAGTSDTVLVALGHNGCQNLTGSGKIKNFLSSKTIFGAKLT
jgi:hypothetical protein